VEIWNIKIFEGEFLDKKARGLIPGPDWDSIWREEDII
jgi:hypothetical protein